MHRSHGGERPRETHSASRNRAQVRPESTIDSDASRACEGLPQRESGRHEIGEYVRRQAHVNGVEFFWALLERGCHGTYHRFTDQCISPVTQITLDF